MLSAALADTVTLPETVEPFVGAVREIAGGVVSEDTGGETEVALLFAAG